MPSTDVIHREGGFALAAFGNTKKAQERAFAVAFGRQSFAVKPILKAAFFSVAFGSGCCAIR